MLRNHRMMTLKLTRMDVCNILIALAATKEANDGQRWDEVHEKVKLALMEFDKELDKEDAEREQTNELRRLKNKMSKF
jgi:hypothetical protein